MTSGALEIKRLYTVMYQSRQSVSQRPYTNGNKWYDIGVTPQKSYLVVKTSSSKSYIAVQPLLITVLSLVKVV